MLELEWSLGLVRIFHGWTGFSDVEFYRPTVRVSLSIFVLLLIAASLSASADETLQKVQRELRARKYYAGAVDGRLSLETRAALREFQTAKGIDATGEADEETLRALGLRKADALVTPEAQALRLGREWLAGFCEASASGDWAREEPFYAEKVRYYYEGEITRAELRRLRAGENAGRRAKPVPVLCYATWSTGRGEELWISARVRNELSARETVTEELRYIVRRIEGQWRLVEVREWPLERGKAPKVLP